MSRRKSMVAREPNGRRGRLMGGVTGLTFVAGQSVNMAFNLALQDFDAFHSGLNGSLTEAGTGMLNVTLTAPTHV
jgi:hypothetical protein